MTMAVEGDTQCKDLQDTLTSIMDPASFVKLEHSYTSTSLLEKGILAKPPKFLFFNPKLADRTNNYVIDVSTVHPAKTLLPENADDVNSYVKDEEDDNGDWESRIDRRGWNGLKSEIFQKITRILEKDHLARLVYEKSSNEKLKYYITSEKTGTRIRRLFTSFGWDIPLIHWIHSLLTDHLPSYYMAGYTEAMQHLRKDLPSHVLDNNVSISIQAKYSRMNDARQALKKKDVDPFLSLLNENKQQRLPRSPILLMVPTGTRTEFPAHTPMKRWMNEFSNISALVRVVFEKGEMPVNAGLAEVVEEVFMATRCKITEIRSSYPNRPIVLIGVGCGCSLALRVALAEKVDAVVCLGYSANTLGGKFDLEFEQYRLDTSIMFVIGENSYATTFDEIEKQRLKLNCRSGLIFVGGANNDLLVNHSTKMENLVSQGVIDRCIVNEVDNFLSDVLTSPTPLNTRFSLNSKTSHNVKADWNDSITLHKKIVNKEFGENVKVETSQSSQDPTIKSQPISFNPTQSAAARNRSQNIPKYVSMNVTPYLFGQNSYGQKSAKDIINILERTCGIVVKTSKKKRTTKRTPRRRNSLQITPCIAPKETVEEKNAVKNVKPAEDVVEIRSVSHCLQSSGKVNNVKDEVNTTCHNILIRNGQISVEAKNGNFTKSGLEYFSSLFQKGNMSQVQCFSKSNASETAINLSKRKMDGVTITPCPVPAKRPYVRKNPVTRKKRLPLLKTSSRIVNITSDELNAAVASITPPSRSNFPQSYFKAMSQPLSVLTPDNIRDLPVIFADDQPMK